MAGSHVHWRVIQRYFGKLENEYHPEIFEPHVQPEDLHWRKAEEALYNCWRWCFAKHFFSHALFQNPTAFWYVSALDSLFNKRQERLDVVGIFTTNSACKVFVVFFYFSQKRMVKFWASCIGMIQAKFTRCLVCFFDNVTNKLGIDTVPSGCLF